MISFQPFHGIITLIEDFATNNPKDQHCIKLISITSDDNFPINFIIFPDTYIVNHVMLGVGDMITAFIDANAPVPLIYPPRYNVLVVAKDNYRQQVTVDYFNHNLINSSQTLKLNIGPHTHVILKNNQPFRGNPGEHNLIVQYSFTTRSIPAQTTPEQVVVLCDS